MEEIKTAEINTGLIYGLNDRPPLREAILQLYNICRLFL